MSVIYAIFCGVFDMAIGTCNFPLASIAATAAHQDKGFHMASVLVVSLAWSPAAPSPYHLWGFFPSFFFNPPMFLYW